MSPLLIRISCKPATDLCHKSTAVSTLNRDNTSTKHISRDWSPHTLYHDKSEQLLSELGDVENMQFL